MFQSDLFPAGEQIPAVPLAFAIGARILALPIALQNAIFDEYLGLVEARIEAAREAGTLDQGLETVRVDRFTFLADELLRTDPVTGAEICSREIPRASKLPCLSTGPGS